MAWFKKGIVLGTLVLVVMLGVISAGVAGEQEAAPFFFIFCGDSRFGSDSSSDHPEILAQIVEEANVRNPDFFLYGGDGPDHNTEANYTAFKACLDKLTMPYRNVVGNHDIYVEATKGYCREHQLAFFGDPYYTFEYEDSFFLVLDSAGHGARPWGIRDACSEEWDWMVQELEANVSTHRHAFVVSHTPPYDAPPRDDHAFTDTTEAAEFVALMAESGVTMVLASHEHLFYETEWGGVPYIISGGAGATLWPNGFYHYVEICVGEEITRKVIPVLKSIAIYSSVPAKAPFSVNVGNRMGFVARGTDPTGQVVPIEPPMDRVWSSSHPSVGVIDPVTGVFEGMSGGVTEVRVTSGLTSGTVTVRVEGETETQINDSGRSFEAPKAYSLSQNVPNPFNDSTRIGVQLPRAGAVELAVFDVLGRRIRTLLDGRVEAGSYTARWDGRDDAGRVMASGVYLCRLEAKAGGVVGERKMVYMR